MVRRISYAWMAAVCVLALHASVAMGARKAPDLTVTKLSLAGTPAPGQAVTVASAVATPRG
jgi:hypothetical protein